METATPRTGALRSLGLVLTALGLVALAPSATTQQLTTQAALQTGNGLFRAGQIDAAIETYTAGYRPESPHPTLLYNLGTALHHEGRLPEAILWYRRAAASDDPWLVDNLRLARRSLGSRALPAGGTVGWLRQQTPALRLAAIVLAWITLALALAGARAPTWVVTSTLGLAVTLYATAWATERWGPRPAVVLVDCRSSGGDLPAGTEAWVRETGDGQWLISGSTGVTCPAESLEIVFPD